MLFNPRLNGTFDLVLHYIKNQNCKKTRLPTNSSLCFSNPTGFPTYPNSTMSQMSQFHLINKV